MSEQYIYSEIFHSFQGEGLKTGTNTAWVRLFNCNLNCHGFMQKDPTDPSTYELPYQDFDPSTVERLEDLPVWSKGCDSSYSWARQFKDLNHKATGEEIAERIMEMLTNDDNPYGTFVHERSKQPTDLCFTGGEPMLPKNQRAMLDIVSSFETIAGGPVKHYPTMRLAHNLPPSITLETNGTQKIREAGQQLFHKQQFYGNEVFFSVSPKLFTVSGEKPELAIKPDIIRSYYDTSKSGQLKFVVGNEDRQWEELDRVIGQMRDAGVEYPVSIMPVGALDSQQDQVAAAVSDRALARGFHVSARVHTYVYGNHIGT